MKDRELPLIELLKNSTGHTNPRAKDIVIEEIQFGTLTEKGFNILRDNYGFTITEIGIFLKYYLLPKNPSPEFKSRTKTASVAAELSISEHNLRNQVSRIRACLPVPSNWRYVEVQVMNWAVDEEIIVFDKWVARLKQSYQKQNIP